MNFKKLIKENGIKNVYSNEMLLNNYIYSKIQLLIRMYGTQNNKCKVMGYKIGYSKIEYIKFGLKSIEFDKLFIQWINSGFEKNLVPSFDRKNDYKGYSFDNFNKWMTWIDNKKKAENDRIIGKNNKVSKAVIGINIINDKVVKFHSMMEAQRNLDINYSNIAMCCKGKRKTAGNYRWKYDLNHV